MMQKPAQTYCTAEDAEPDRDELTALRHRIHQHPELSHKEVETARATDWHTDSTFEDTLPLLAVLHAKEVPSEKGGTMFAAGNYRPEERRIMLRTIVYPSRGR